MPEPTKRTRTLGAADPLNTPALSESLRALARRGMVRSYRKGTLLIQEGDQGDTLYIILEGRLRSFGTGTNGREITYGTYGAGEYLGEMSLDGGPRSASVETLQPSTCVVVTRASLMAHIAEVPDFAFELLAKVIRRARAATLSAKQMAVNDVYGRLSAWLMAHSELRGDGARSVTGSVTHAELAKSLGCSREMVSRLLKDLTAGGYLESTADGLALLKPLPPRW